MIKLMIPTIFTSLIIGIVILTVFGFQEAESTSVVIVDFGDGTIDTSGGRVCGAAVDAYLAGFGITAIDSGSGGPITDFCIWQFDRSTTVHAIASSLPNGFFRNFGNEAYSYSLVFATPLDSFQFTRTSYDTSFGGIISEAWNAQPFDSVGNPLGPVVGELLQSRTGFSAPIQFSFIGPDIAKVTFFRNTVNTFAGIAQVPLDDLILTIPDIATEPTCDGTAANIFKKFPGDDASNTFVVDGVDVEMVRWDKDMSGTIEANEGWIIKGTGNKKVPLDDVVVGTDKDDLIKPGHGDDIVCAGAGDDLLQGGHGDDTLFGEAGDDTLKGGHGEDLMNGGDDNDTLEGGQDDDTLNGGAGTDTADGGKGIDTCSNATPSNCEL